MLHDFLHAMCRVFAFTQIAEFFDNDANNLVSARGRQILNDPALMAQVHEQMKAWKEAYKRGEVRGPCVVHLGARPCPSKQGQGRRAIRCISPPGRGEDAAPIPGAEDHDQRP